MAHPEFAQEEKKLQSILHYLANYNEIILTEKKEIDRRVDYSIRHFNSDNAEQFTELTLNIANQDYLTQKTKDVSNGLQKPYFARVDFIPDDEKVKQALYIGKMTLLRDSDNTLLITDWRAPIASLYYEGRLGESQYECPEGIITGEITLKRQYMIERGKLLDITDIDITTNDEFLQAALGSSKDRRLKDIVTTIQAEQNRIIRANMFRPLVVQGAAGGGKTTIALHRIAYLLYTHEKKITPKSIMILAPNRFFLSYISDVLPDLGVENVVQSTFEDYAQAFIGRKLKLKPAIDTIAHVVNHQDYHSPMLQASHLKSSLAFKQVIEKYYKVILHKLVPKNHFEIEGYVIIPQTEIAQLFLKGYKHLPVAKRSDELKKNLTNALRRKKPQLLELIDTNYDEVKNRIKKEMPDGEERRSLIIKLLDERDAKLKAVVNKSKTAVRSYMQQFKLLPPEKYYLLLMKNDKLLLHLCRGLFTEDECQLILLHTNENLNSNLLETEDLPPIMVLKRMLYGTDDGPVNRPDYPDIKHIVIDEAQDYSLFQFSLMKDLLRSQSFSILGDLNQGIYAYKGIDDWQDVLEQVLDERPQYLTLEQSYRTTTEIMDAANTVIALLGRSDLPVAKPVIRHGDPVGFLLKTDLSEIGREIDLQIKTLTKNGFRSIAIICKTLPECHALHKAMKSKPNLITGGENDFSGGVSLIPSYLVKGLEFDAVLIANANADNYRHEAIDIKLLYIGMTRALHHLTIYSAGAFTPLLQNAGV